MRRRSKPSKNVQLRDNEEQLELHRRRAQQLDREIFQRTDSLVQEVGRVNREVREREELVTELAQARTKYQQDLVSQRQRLQAKYAKSEQRQAMLALEQARANRSQADADLALETLEHETERERLAEARSLQIAEAEQTQRDLVSREERSASYEFNALVAMQCHARQLTEERDEEASAAQAVTENLSERQRTALRRDEALLSEIQSQEMCTEELKDGHRVLEARLRSLGQELSQATYVVGQRDQALKVKNSELHEVRQSLLNIQDDMDNINSELKEQCGRMHRAERVMDQPEDLDEKIAVMRGMVKESHNALGQLCLALETERTWREHHGLSLKQQKIRSELLLRLLHNVKGRTQDLRPESLIAGFDENAANTDHFGFPGASADEPV